MAKDRPKKRFVQQWGLLPSPSPAEQWLSQPAEPKRLLFCYNKGVLGPIPAPDRIKFLAGEKINGKINKVRKIGAGMRRSWNLFETWLSPQQLSKGLS